MDKEYNNLVTAHKKYIYSIFGDDVRINFGWATDDDFICSKIYDTKQAVTSEIGENGVIKHMISDL